MALNPMMLMQLKASWDSFVQNHPKFPRFWKAACRNGLTEGTIIEFKVTTPEGKELCSNIKLTSGDLDLMRQLQELM